MTTSPTAKSFLSEIAESTRIPIGTLAYFQARTRNNVYDFIISKFLEKERAGEMTRADLARKIRKSPVMISKLLGAPGNWTIETISDLLLGIAAEELTPQSESVLGRKARNVQAKNLLEEEGRVLIRFDDTSTDTERLGRPERTDGVRSRSDTFRLVLS